MIDRAKPYIAGAAGLAIAALALTAWALQQRLETVSAQLETCAGNTGRLQAALTSQNAAIRRLNAEADAARREVEAARRDAERQAARHDLRAAELRQWQRRAGEDDCAAARRLLAEVPR